MVIDLSHQRYNLMVPYVRALLHVQRLHHRSYRASQLPRALRAASEVVIVTSESSTAEVNALCQLCGGVDPVDAERWSCVLGELGPKRAAALPVTEECEGNLRLFTMAQRLTPHVRHREKYADVPVPQNRAFVFTSGGVADARASTLREFVATLERSEPRALAGHLARGDFSRWIREVFGDRALALELETQEERYRSGVDDDVVPEIGHAIRARYDLTATDGREPSAASAASAPPS